MKKTFKLIILVLLLFVLLPACSNNDVSVETDSKTHQVKSTETEKKAGDKQTINGFEPSYNEGEDYSVLEKPYETGITDKVVVYEFFGYTCPHCFNFEPFLKKFIDSQPEYATLQRVPQRYHESWFIYQQAYLTAEMMGFNNEEIHQKLFNAIHTHGQRFSTIDQLAEWYEKEAGIDKAKFISTADSFIIDSKQREADKMGFMMQVISTPSMVVNGKYVVSKKILDRDEVINITKFLTKKAGIEMGLIPE